jgi:hypothetical protein
MENKSTIKKYQNIILEKTKMIENTEKQICLMFFYICKLNYYTNKVINNYRFFINGFIYHQKRYFHYLNEIINTILNMENFNITDIKDISVSDNQIGPLSFELECIIVKFYRILQKPIKDQFMTFFEHDIKDKYKNIFPKYDSIDSFYLRIKILRDNIIHMIDTKYVEVDETIVHLYFENSAQILNILHFENGQIKLYNTLLDIKYNENLRNHIANNLKNGQLRKTLSETIKTNAEVNEKNNRKKIFMESAIAGPNMIVFDCYNHYFDLFNEMHSYLFNLNLLIMSQILKNNKSKIDDLIKLRTFFNGEEISYNSVFYK